VIYQPCQPVDLTDPDVLDVLPEVIEELFRSLYTTLGIALSASQIGILWQLAVIDSSWTGAEGGKRTVLINPSIEPAPNSKLVSFPETCLSLPGYRADVWRPDRILVSTYSLAGEKVEFEANGIHARAIQHEVDHFYGKLYADLLEPGVLGKDPSDGSTRFTRRLTNELELQSSVRRNPHFQETGESMPS
jgi:peptide deformylase